MALRNDELGEPTDGVGDRPADELAPRRLPLALAPLALGGVQLELLSGPFAITGRLPVRHAPSDDDSESPPA